MRKIVSAFLLLSIISPMAFGGAFDRIGVGSRPKGMGDAYTAVADDIYSIYWNPAGLSKVKRKAMALMYKDLYGLGLVDYGFFSYVQPGFGQGTVAFGWTRLGTSYKVDFLEYAENTFAFAYGANFKRPFRNFSYGIGIKYYLVDYETGRASGSGLDLALRYQKDDIALALVGQDVNTPAIWWQTGNKDTITPNYRFGFAYFSDFATLAFDLDQLKSPRARLHLGIEKWFKKDAFALRAGAFNITESIWNTTLGATMGIMKDFSLDYAFEIHNELGNTHLLSLNMKF
ncbi:MAG: hypothetical protein ABII64_10040 [Elusimicrobiota bacterium]